MLLPHAESTLRAEAAQIALRLTDAKIFSYVRVRRYRGSARGTRRPLGWLPPFAASPRGLARAAPPVPPRAAHPESGVHARQWPPARTKSRRVQPPRVPAARL